MIQTNFLIVGMLMLSTSERMPRIAPKKAIFIRSVIHPEIRDTIYINPDSTLILPLVGEVKIPPMTLKEFKDTLETLFSKYYVEPALDVIPLDLVFVFGSVRQPGKYLLPEHSTVVDLLAVSGGPVPTANLKSATLKRQEDLIRINLDATVKGEIPPEELKTGDILYIPEKTIFLRLTNIQTIVSLAILAWNIYLYFSRQR